MTQSEQALAIKLEDMNSIPGPTGYREEQTLKSCLLTFIYTLWHIHAHTLSHTHAHTIKNVILNANNSNQRECGDASVGTVLPIQAEGAEFQSPAVM